MNGESTPSDNDLTAEIERLQFALQAATVGTWDYDLLNGQAQWSAICKELFGLSAQAEATAPILLEQVHPDDRERVRLANARVLSPDSDGRHNIRFRTLNPQGTLRWVEAKGQVLRDPQGEVVRFSGIVQEITHRVLDRQKIEESEARFRSLIEEAPVATMLMVGPHYTIELANEAMIQMLGKGTSILGQPATSALSELTAQLNLQLLDQVFTSGIAYETKAMPGELWVNGVATLRYYDFTYKPMRHQMGEVYGILAMAVDVTEQLLARQKVEESEAHLQLLRDTVPAMIFYLDAQQRYQSYNDTFMHWFGVNKDEVIGKTVLEFLGETVYQALVPHLAIAYGGQPEQYELFAPSRMGDTRWLNITYTPHHTPTGEVVGLIVHAADITLNKQSEAILRDQEAALLNAIELAELGTFNLDVPTQVITVSPRVADWFGFESLVTDAELFIAGVGENDRERVRTSLYNPLLPGTNGCYDVTHSVIHAQTGRQRILHALGQVYFDDAGKAIKIEGTVQDVTAERERQLALSNEVQTRTEELAAVNEELLVQNQEYAAVNDKLEEANSDLRRSNQNLEQFAYIASHDLQEPLRKIQQFGDLLTNQYGKQLGDGLDYLQRMQSAASRMSTLVRDLLTYSRIATQRESNGPVSLTTVLTTAVTDLELRIEETGATLNVAPLPTVMGDASQLGQLFHNLLSNALKFSCRDESGKLIPPLIAAKAVLIGARDLPPSVKPSRAVEIYHRIDIIDNGIGFEEKYLDRIFHVFQRLHGKNEFAGTGIGLAICEKVVANHGGAITASSKPGQGATFCVYLPA